MYFYMQEPPGHFWLVAPPLSIVDCTLHAQQWQHGEGAYLPPLLISETAARATVTPVLYAPPQLRTPTPPQAHQRLWRWLPPLRETVGLATVSYCPGGVTAPSDALARYSVRIGAKSASDWFSSVRGDL